MASKILTCIALVLTLHATAAIASSIKCEDVDVSECAFAVSTSGFRCVLEKKVRRHGWEDYVCHTSAIKTDTVKDWIETDECIEACGLHRRWVGISSDALLEPRFMHKLCSDSCYRGCPNLADLYFSLAAAEGIFLPSVCEGKGEKKRREMKEINKSSGEAEGVAHWAEPGEARGDPGRKHKHHHKHHHKHLPCEPAHPPL